MSDSTTTVKRGATLELNASVSNASGPVNITGWTIKSQVWTAKGTKVADLTVATANQIAPNVGAFKLTAATALWPVGEHVMDIAYSYSNGVGGNTITYTDKVVLVVEQSYTVMP